MTSWTIGHRPTSHDIDDVVVTWAADVRKALALHDRLMGHSWMIASDPDAESWEDARCGRCGMRLYDAFLDVRGVSPEEARWSD